MHANLISLPISLLRACCDVSFSKHIHSTTGGYGLSHIVICQRQLACALCGLREANILHQDVKPDKFLLMANKYEFEDLVLADFGAGRIIAEEGSRAAGGCVMPRLSIGRNNNNVGSTAADHVSIE